LQEEWKEIELYGLTYKVSNYGEIIGKRKKIKLRYSDDNYLECSVGYKVARKTVRVHRIVAMLFIPNPNNYPEINHKDFKRENNRVDNLEWCTHKQNIKYSNLYNREVQCLKSRGENNGRAILTEDDVINIRNLYDKNGNAAEIARIYNRGWQTINHIIKRTTWNYI
jgi:hypothetical protein